MLVYRVEDSYGDRIYNWGVYPIWQAYDMPEPFEDLMWHLKGMEAAPISDGYLFGFDSLFLLDLWWSKDYEELEELKAIAKTYEVDDELTDCGTQSIIFGGHQLCFNKHFAKQIDIFSISEIKEMVNKHKEGAYV